MADDLGDVPDLLEEGVPNLRSGQWRLSSWEQEEIRVHRGRRFVFGTMRYWDETGTASRLGVVVKAYKRDPGSRSLRAMELLWDRGLRAPAPYRVPRPLGRIPRDNVLIQERVWGEPWSGVLEGRGEGASAGAAGWLARLQAGPAAGVAGRAPGDAPSSTRPRHPGRLAGDLVRRYPAEERRLEPVAGRLLAALARADDPVPSHGDYHPDNVFVASGAVTAIDFDNFGVREAGYDVGYAIGQLLIMSRLRSGSFASGARAAADFWRRYEEEGTATPDRVGAHVSRTFLQSLHYELVVLENGRTDLIGPWTDQMDRWLRKGGPGTLEDLVRHS